jgi:hypothetical protein
MPSSVGYICRCFLPSLKSLFLPPRIRGYHSDRLKLPGFATGVIESYYYALPESKLKMQEYWPVSLGSSSWVFSHGGYITLLT